MTDEFKKIDLNLEEAEESTDPLKEIDDLLDEEIDEFEEEVLGEE